MKEEFKKMDELLQSNDAAERELGLQMVENHVKNNRPCNTHFEKDKDYMVTWMRAGLLRDIVRETHRYFEGRFNYYDESYVKHHVLRFRHGSIRCEDVLEILPINERGCHPIHHK
jgi:hypothetical protein